MQQLNKVWASFPQIRFLASRIFSGCILWSGTKALLVNCVETYGRLKTIDAHHERRITSTTGQSSFPTSRSRYGDVVVCLAKEDGTTKLKIGGSSFNLLVTSSVRVDEQSITNAVVEKGANTGNFVPQSDARISVDAACLQTGNDMLNDLDTSAVDDNFLFFNCDKCDQNSIAFQRIRCVEQLALFFQISRIAPTPFGLFVNTILRKLWIHNHRDCQKCSKQQRWRC